MAAVQPVPLPPAAAFLREDPPPARASAACRADSIVKDAEVVRKALVPSDNSNGRWSVLGQSFGGFCALTYLSFAPEGEMPG